MALPFFPQPKPASRLQARIAAKPLTTVTEKAFRTEVWTRDKSRCRCCGRKVLKAMGRVPERGEVHHIHGRGKDLRFEARASVLLCLECHEKVTGRVNEKLIIEATKAFQMRGEWFTDARCKIHFRKVV